MIYVWKIFLAQKFLADSPVSLAPGSCFKIPITLWKSERKQNDPSTSLIGPEWTDWEKKTGAKKSHETVPY